MMGAFLLYPLAFWQLGGRALRHTLTHLTKRAHPMARPAPDTTVIIERLEAERHWDEFRLKVPSLIVHAQPWQFTTSEYGPLWSMELRGAQAAEALTEFAAGAHGIPHLRPLLDGDVPGWVACVWRSGGVWLEVWHADPVAAAHEPVATPVPSMAGRPAPVHPTHQEGDPA